VSARKRPPAKRRRPLGALLPIVLVAALGLGAAAVKEAGDPRFALGQVVVTGERMTPESDVLSAAALPSGANVWLLDTASAERRVEALPWIASAAVRRSWPNRLSVTVHERAPALRLLLPAGAGEEPDTRIALLDAGLRVLATLPEGRSPADLPLFHIEPPPAVAQPGQVVGGDDIAGAYDAMMQLRALGLRISEVDVKPAIGVSVTCEGGLRVILGSDEDLEKKVSLFKAIAPKISSPRDVMYVDLRSVRAPTVLYR